MNRIASMSTGTRLLGPLGATSAWSAVGRAMQWRAASSASRDASVASDPVALADALGHSSTEHLSWTSATETSAGPSVQLQSSGSAVRSGTKSQHAPTITPAQAFEQIIQMHDEAIPGPSPAEAAQLLAEAKNLKELKRVVHELIWPHPLFRDMLGGHGFRVLTVNKLLAASTRVGDIDVLFDHLALCRAMGFTVTRAYCAVVLDNMKHYLNTRFQSEGRNPGILRAVLRRCRELRAIALEDRVPYDFIMHTREVHIATSLAGIYDRQNLYRANFPTDDIPRREGIVVDWVVAHCERVTDFDEAISETKLFVEEALSRVRTQTNCRPSFSFMMRLAEYYFSIDDSERMLGVIEDCHQLGIEVAESVYAKFMQMACAFNLAEVPELHLRLRAARPQCTLATQDISRLLGYYGRAGGGRPCPECGEPYNHRNPSIDVWERTPESMRSCKLLEQARVFRGVLEDNPDVPQCRDNSAVAFALWDLSQQRSVVWGTTEWRMFLHCNVFSPRALDAVALVDEHFARDRWDEFLGATYMRVLRFNDPSKIMPVIERWVRDRVHLSPLALQQAVKGQLLLTDDEYRVEGLERLLALHYKSDIYTTRYADRLITGRLDQLSSASTDGNEEESGIASMKPGLLKRERQVLEEFRRLAPRTAKVMEKDSVSDVLPMQTKRHLIYV